MVNWFTATPKTQYSLQDQIQGTIKNPLGFLTGTPPTVLSTKGQTTSSINLPSVGSVNTALATIKTAGEVVKTAAIATGLTGAAVAAFNFFKASPSSKEYIASLPKKLTVTAPAALGKLIEDPSLSGAATFAKENPEATAAAAAAALLLGGKFYQGYSTWKQTKSFDRSADAAEDALKLAREEAEKIKEREAAVVGGTAQPIINYIIQPPAAAPISTGTPITPTQPEAAAAPITKKKTTKKKKAKKKKAKPKKKAAPKRKKPKKKTKKYIKKKKKRRR